MKDILNTICQVLEQGESLVSATIVSRQGSTPRTAGSRMIVRRDGTGAGTIGGGLVEARAMAAAAEVLASGAPRVISFDLTHDVVAAMDMICGGRLDVLLEPVSPLPETIRLFRRLRQAIENSEKSLLVTSFLRDGGRIAESRRTLLVNGETAAGERPAEPGLAETLWRSGDRQARPELIEAGGWHHLLEPFAKLPTVHLFGAGHVSRPTAIMAGLAGFRVVVIDDRADYACRERFSRADDIRVLDNFDEALSGQGIDRDDYLVILTRGHMHDKTVLAQALQTDAGYIGMIGSRRKRDAIYRALREEGFTDKHIRRVYSPIGLDIGAETPEEIAVSIVAQLVQVRAEKASG